MRGRSPKVVPLDPDLVPVGPTAATRLRELGVPVHERGFRLYAPRWAASSYEDISDEDDRGVFRDVAWVVLVRKLGDAEAAELLGAARAVGRLAGRVAAWEIVRSVR